MKLLGLIENDVNEPQEAGEEVFTDKFVCRNSRCITSTEQELPQQFKLTDKENNIWRCRYCETRAE
ncbi:MAG: hypothetical protein LUC38_00110 [Oscillospiraceae bacterium]|nr:hypothetical protein [Oscillospiraceae bacterium]